eukprot:CAMPEP_0118671170 /NCGR_PEP_ID=MMETSP0785-20121206/21859_1 /TAXON_ID=91992 /ORGANISM="Bolidomonas pacifica, Strain CCMP 1866" /LENGTH=115 /DNA_ID=CAMNT_0006566037 /DNA_START=73 /DNA_END=416 /DNA_ORIENTATION=-
MKFGQTLLITALALSQSSAFGLSRSASPKSHNLAGRFSPLESSSPLVKPIGLDNVVGTSLNTATPAMDSAQSMPRGGVLSSLKNIDLPLMAYFFFWYVGNYYYNITNKLALKAAG